MEFPAIVELNVGGKYFTTSLATLRKDPDSRLAAMFSGGRELKTDNEGRYFIDCDGDVFACILEYLRFGTVPSGDMVPKVLACANYFNIAALKDELKMEKVSGSEEVVEEAVEDHRESKESSKLLPVKRRTLVAVASVGAGVAAGATAVVAAPFVLAGLGFGAAGVAAGSIAAAIQGPAVASGSLFALCQSAGVLGLATTTKVAIASGIGASVSTVSGAVMSTLTKK